MQYQIGDIREFDVIKDFGDREDFFRLHIPGAGEARLPKLKFQREEPLPDKVKCRIKYINGDMPVPGHFMPQYVNRFYKAGVLQKRDFEFTVIGLPAHAGDKFILEDKYGIRYNLDGRGNILAEGQTVLCHFTKLSNTLFNLELTKSDMRLPFFAPHEFLNEIGVRGIMNSVLIKIAGNTLVDAASEFKSNNPLWVVTALKTATSQLSELFVGSDIKRHNRFFRELLRIIRTGCLYLIENSRFLRNLSGQHRRSIQAVLTEAVESLEPYRDLLKLVVDSRQCEFVENLMHKLRESGYLYHPARQFSMLMMIFRTQPALVREYLGKIFETIMEWRLETWTTEPFRSAFVGQFELYIRQACREIDLLPQADTEEDTDRIEKMVTAIALQMLISGDSTSDRYRRNRSLFYRYISLLRPVKGQDLLDKAFLTLMGVNFPLEFNYDTIKEPMMLMTRATVCPSDEKFHLQSIHTYRECGVEFTVSDDGIALRRTDENNAGRILPNGMMDWLSPQIYLEGVQSLNGSQINSFDAHRRLWANIETALFENRAQAAEAEELHKPEPGDVVKIVISSDETTRSDNPRWVALIDDEHFLAVPGYIFRDDIVGFTLRSSDLDRDRVTAQSAFIGENGRPRHFMATVKEIDAEGMCHFSLLDDVAEQCSNIMSYDETYRAVIAQRHEHEYSGIAETGYGVYLRQQPDAPGFAPGDIVTFRIYDRSNPNHIVGTIIDEPYVGGSLDKVSAFANLMKGISLLVENEDDEEQMTLDVDETLTREDVSEIIELIRFKAISSSTLLLAYDYLQFGRILALAIEDVQLADRLQIHADLLRMHQFYATNRRVDADELELYRPKVQGYPMLEVVFHRLEIVSWLGDSDRNDDLWQTINKQRNLLESNLARLVLSYNMLPPAVDGDADKDVSEGLKTKIARMLGVNFEARQLKSYGRENQFIEFKSSIVYPARKFKHDKIKADPEAQQFVILKIIASFLNSSGGTLYIGVNDSTHCEAGLYEDFEYYKHHRASIGTYQYDMRSVDNMCVFLANLVRFTWGNIVAGNVQIEQDDEAARDVIIVKVQPRTTPVLLDGKIYVRRSGNTNMLLDDERAEFIRERQDLERRKQEDLRVQEAEAVPEDVMPLPAGDPVAGTTDDEAVAETVDFSHQAVPAGISTSGWRHNVLHEWEDGYLSPAGYLYFKDGNVFVRTVEDRQYDYDSDCELALAFTGREATQGVMVIVYDSKRVLKVPMPEIMEKDPDRPVNFSISGKPVFATIALPSDALITYLIDNKNTLYRRVIPLADIEPKHLNSTPDLITEAPGVGGVAACEIAAASSLGAFSSSLAKDMSTRQIGYTLRTTADTDKAQQIIKEDRNAAAPKV